VRLGDGTFSRIFGTTAYIGNTEPFSVAAEYLHAESDGYSYFGRNGAAEPTSYRTKSFSDIAPKRDFSGFWGKVDYFMSGGEAEGWIHNLDGEVTGHSPVAGVGPDVGMGKLLKAAEYGRKMHKMYNPGSLYRLNKEIRGSLTKWRPDAVDYVNKIVRELKPNTLSGIAKGERQLKR